MLIYLDSSQFAWLQRADKQMRAEFSAEWNRLGAELAISLTHLQEIGQLNDKDSVKRRLEVLQYFDHIRGIPAASAFVLLCEAKAQMRAILGDSFDPIVAGRDLLFPEIEVQQIVKAVLDYLPTYQAFFSLAHLATGIQVKNKQVQSSHPKRKSTKGSVDLMRLHGTQFVDQIASEHPEAKEFFASILNSAVASLEAENGHIRRAKARDWGLSEVEVLNQIADEDLEKAAGIYEITRQNLPDVAHELEISLSEASRLMNKIDPYAAPGLRLVLAEQRARSLHPKQPQPSDEVDPDHLIFAPYVDSIFVDKRTLDFVRREQGRDYRLPANAGSNIRYAAKLEDVLQQIRSVVNEDNKS